MGHYDMASLWCAPLSTNTRFRFFFFFFLELNNFFSASDVIKRKRTSKRLREAIKLEQFHRQNAKWLLLRSSVFLFLFLFLFCFLHFSVLN